MVVAVECEPSTNESLKLEGPQRVCPILLIESVMHINKEKKQPPLLSMSYENYNQMIITEWDDCMWNLSNIICKCYPNCFPNDAYKINNGMELKIG